MWKSDGEERYERFRKAGEERWKEKVEDVHGDREGDKTAAFLSRRTASLLGLNNTTQSQNQPGWFSSAMQIPQTARHTHTLVFLE